MAEKQQQSKEPAVVSMPPGAFDAAAAEAEAKRVHDAALARGAAEASAAKGSKYFVAKGLSVSTVRGIVESGKPVTPRDFMFSGTDEAVGRAHIEDLIARGAVVRGG